MEAQHKVLLLDDDPALLELYREMLAQLPSRPEVQTANSGPRAIALLESEPFRLLICDLKMPKMDGLQVLSIVRRKHPELRTVALTSVVDEQFRTRAYALGVDLFWHKPVTEEEIKMFLECLESLLGRESEGGFRGIQSKSLVDLIQMECISQSSSVLRITNGNATGKIWIQDGELMDAETNDLREEAAFVRILSWKSGNFESLPADPTRPRAIFKSCSALLLEFAQAVDESQGDSTSQTSGTVPSCILTDVSKVDGVEFVLTMSGEDGKSTTAKGLENPQRMAVWAREASNGFRLLGERLNVGPLEQIEAYGPQRHVALVRQGDTELCVGWKLSLTPAQLRERMKKVLSLWAS